MVLAGSSPTSTTASPGTIPLRARNVATPAPTSATSCAAIALPSISSTMLLLEHDGLVAVDKDTILKIGADRPREHPPLDVAALAHQFLRAVDMADRLDILMDDRPFIQVGCDEVRRRADHLDPARMRLVIGLGALETGQEAMMDVDAAAREKGGQIVGKDLHVARQHDQIGARVFDDLLYLRFLLRLGVGRHGEVMERDAFDDR